MHIHPLGRLIESMHSSILIIFLILYTYMAIGEKIEVHQQEEPLFLCRYFEIMLDSEGSIDSGYFK